MQQSYGDIESLVHSAIFRWPVRTKCWQIRGLLKFEWAAFRTRQNSRLHLLSFCTLLQAQHRILWALTWCTGISVGKVSHDVLSAGGSKYSSLEFADSELIRQWQLQAESGYQGFHFHQTTPNLQYSISRYAPCSRNLLRPVQSWCDVMWRWGIKSLPELHFMPWFRVIIENRTQHLDISWCILIKLLTLKTLIRMATLCLWQAFCSWGKSDLVFRRAILACNKHGCLLWPCWLILLSVSADVFVIGRLVLKIYLEWPVSWFWCR